MCSCSPRSSPLLCKFRSGNDRVRKIDTQLSRSVTGPSAAIRRWALLSCRHATCNPSPLPIRGVRVNSDAGGNGPGLPPGS
jgi:hypothetical protein